jgi:hypothetical protein
MASKSMQELAQEYGFAYAFFSSDAELKKLLQQAWSGKWSAAKFQAKFMTTKWYRSREASVRQWADLVARDPAEVKNKIAESKAQLSDQFSQLGIDVDDALLTSLATQRLQWSWTDAQTQDILASYFQYDPATVAGTPAAVEAQIRDTAYQYGVDVSDAQMQDWISGVIGQSYNEDSLTDYIRDMAKSKYAGMSGYLETGMTVRQVAAPYLQEYARLMETDPNTVSLNDPLMAGALQGTMDPKTGQNTMMTVSQMQKAIKQDQRWLYTSNAKTDMTDLGLGILKDMGLYS